MSQLGELTHYQKSEISKIVNELIEESYITMTIDAQDRRIKHLYPTPKTDQPIASILELCNWWLDQLFEGYSAQERETLYQRLIALAKRSSTILEGEKKNVQTEMIYFPEILRELKNDWDVYEAKMKKYQTVDILCIDDIGAEKVSEWSRDEVLGTILQTRMNHHLTTFFTSNLNLKELERHFITNDKSDEKIKARRIMERIKQLSTEMVMVSENRRD